VTIFGAIGIAGTGLTVHRKWLDAISDNLANVNDATATDATPFRARYVVASAMNYGTPAGVQVSGVALGDAEGRLTYEPTHPLADAEGYVKYPEIDTASQMTQLIMAQRAYQANAAVIDRARETYTAAIQIGRS
jgi:flagellar basal-body rod protein FlgC